MQSELDPDYAGSAAAIYKETKAPGGGHPIAPICQRTFPREMAVMYHPPSTPQLAWLLLNKPGSERDLFEVLRKRAYAVADFSAEQRKSLDSQAALVLVPTVCEQNRVKRAICLE